MRLLVLGGTKFFGRELVRLASEAGHRVTVLSRRCPAPELPAAVEQVRGDRGSAGDLKGLAARDWDAVIDNICYRSGEAALAARIFGGRVGRWVMTSTASVYYAFRRFKKPVFREDWAGSAASGPARRAAAFPYGILKWKAEEALRRAHREKGFPAVMLRYPMVVGPDDPMERGLSYLWRLSQRGPLIAPGGGERWRWLWSGDAARALLEAAAAPGIEGEVFNIADLQAWPVREWIALCGQALGVRADILDIPAQWLDARKFSYQAAPFASEGGFALDVSKARSRLGWRSTSVPEWTRRLAEWYRTRRPTPPANAAFRSRELELAREWLAARRPKPRAR